MTELINIANTALILGSIYLGFSFGWHGLTGMLLLLCIIWGFAFWGYRSNTDKVKDHLIAETDLLKAEAEYYRRKK